MKPPSMLLAAALFFAVVNAPLAQTESSPVEAVALKLDADPKEREAAGKRLEAFLLERDSAGRTFVDPAVDRAALGAAARAWGRKADAGRLAKFVVVSTPESGLDKRLRALLTGWTGAARVKRGAEKAGAIAFLEDAADKAAKVLADPRARRELDAAIAAEDAAVPLPSAGRASIGRAKALREKQGAKADAGVFGPARAAQELPQGASGGGAAAGEARGGVARRTPEEIAAALNEAFRDGRGEPKRPAIGNAEPPPVVYHALGSAEVAREPGMLDRAASLAARDAPVIAADLRQIRDSLKDADLPTVNAINDGNASAIREFFVWLRSAKESDMPSIDYTIMPKGEVGHYELGLLGKGDIKVNHFIRGEPARMRASVVVHELYHYWDKKVARNPYPNVSYGMIDPANKHIHEYDAYLATSLYWEMVKNEGDASPLARLLDRIPTDPGQVRELVNEAVGGRK